MVSNYIRGPRKLPPGQNLAGVPAQGCWDHCSQHSWDTATFPGFRKRHLRLGSRPCIQTGPGHVPVLSAHFFTHCTGHSSLGFSSALEKLALNIYHTPGLWQRSPSAGELPSSSHSGSCPPQPAPLFRACSILTSYSVFPGFFTNYNFWDYKDIAFLFHCWVLNVTSTFVLMWGIPHLVNQDWFMQKVTTTIFIFNLGRRLMPFPKALPVSV